VTPSMALYRRGEKSLSMHIIAAGWRLNAAVVFLLLIMNVVHILLLKRVKPLNSQVPYQNQDVTENLLIIIME